ncbi:MAG: response regulator [Myxococcota bacterium]
MKMFPYYSLPLRFVIVDDNVEFLGTTKRRLHQLGVDQSRLVLFANPAKALKFLANHAATDPLLERWTIKHKPSSEDGPDHFTATIDNLHETAENPNRFNRVSLVATDYEMPGMMNGLELCDKIGNSYAQKLLLTGVVTDDKVIMAFKAGKIQQFVRKQEGTKMFEELRDTMVETEGRYFEQMQGIKDPMLSDPAFVNHAQKVKAELGIEEHYLYKNARDILLLDKDAKHYGLFVRSAGEIAALLQTPQARTAPAEVLQRLRNGNSVLCYPGARSTTELEGSKWGAYVHPAKVTIMGRNEKYLCCLVPRGLPVQEDKIVSFNAYKQANPCIEPEKES